MELEDAPRYTRDAWTRDNNLGLRWASEGRWLEAADAFARAVELSQADFHDEPTPFGSVDFDHDEAHAILLTNLSQAQFEIGRVDEALATAERACTMRLALLGENAIPVARSQSQIAVILGFQGRLGEAQALIAHALAMVAQQVPEYDLTLAPFLENAARLALASGETAEAEPHLLRLHALLAENGQSVAVVDELFEQITAVRLPQAGEAPTDAMDNAEHQPIVSADEWSDASTAEAPLDEPDEAAVEASLRATVEGMSPAEIDAAFEEIPEVATEVSFEESVTSSFDGTFEELASGATRLSGSFESVHVLDSVALPIEVSEPVATGDLDVLDLQLELNEAREIAHDAAHVDVDKPAKGESTDDIFGGASFDLVEPPPPTLNAVPQRQPVTPSRANPLGFEVEYGVPQQPYEPTDLALPEESVNPPMEARVSPLDQPTPLVMPGRDGEARAANGSVNADLRLTLHPPDVDNPQGESRRSRRSSTGSRFGRTKAADPKRPWLIAAAILLVTLAGVLLYTGVLARR